MQADFYTRSRTHGRPVTDCRRVANCLRTHNNIKSLSSNPTQPNPWWTQCRIKLLGGPVPNADGGPCPLSLRSPYPCRIHNSLSFKVGFGTYRHNDDKCTHTDYITWLYLFKWGLLRRSRSFKVIKIGINQKPICDFLLVVNSNWHTISYRFGVIASYWSHFAHFAFFEPPFRGLGTTYEFHLGLIGKRVVDFIVLIELFFARCYRWGASGENRSKISDFAPMHSVWPKI